MSSTVHKGRRRRALATRLCLSAVLSALSTGLLCGAGNRPLEIAYAVRDDHLHVFFDLAGHLPAVFLERVESGLTAALTVRTSVLPVSIDGTVSEAALTTTTRRCEVRYDLWEESYAVTLTEEVGRRRLLAGDREAALSVCVSPGWLPLVYLDELDLRRRYLVQVVLDTDPDGPQTRARTREYLGDPGRAGTERSEGRSLLGRLARALFREGSDDGSTVLVLHGVPFGEPLLSQALMAAERLEDAGSVSAVNEEEEEE